MKTTESGDGCGLRVGRLRCCNCATNPEMPPFLNSIGLSTDEYSRAIAILEKNATKVASCKGVLGQANPGLSQVSGQR